MRKLILSLAAAAGVFAAVGGAEAAPSTAPSPHALPVAVGAPSVQPMQYYAGPGPYGYHRPYGYYRHHGYYRGDGYWRWRRHVARRWYRHHGWY